MSLETPQTEITTPAQVVENTPAALSPRESSLQAAEVYIAKIDTKRFKSFPLRETQKWVAVAFESWLRNNAHSQSPMLGHVIAPMGVGKLGTAVVLSEMVDGITVFFAHNIDLANEAVRTFEEHYNAADSASSSGRSIGTAFGGRAETEGVDIIVAHLNSAEKLEGVFATKNVGLVVIDEADVNTLSVARRELINTIASNHGIPVVAMSATDTLSNGDQLQSLFPDEIMSMVVPAALPTLREMDLIPEIDFHDLVITGDLILDESSLLGDSEISKSASSQFIRSPGVRQKMLFHFITNYRQPDGSFPTAITVFRDNALLDEYILEGEKLGIKIAKYTGDMTPEQREETRAKLKNGEIHMLVGSGIAGRGLNIEEISVVYNATVTRSPQIFWQAEGRAMRKDPQNPAKHSHLIAVLPSTVYDEQSGLAIPKFGGALSHADFFDPDYYDEMTLPAEKNRSKKSSNDDSGVKQKKPPREKSISVKNLKNIRSNDQVIGIRQRLMIQKYYYGKINAIADFFDHRQGLPVSEGEAFWSAQIVQAFRVAGMYSNDSDPYSITAPEECETNDNDAPESFNLLDGDHEIRVLTLAEEKFYVNAYTKGRGSDATEEERKNSKQAEQYLLRAHLPIIKAVAKHVSKNPADVDDLMQEGSIAFLNTLKKLDGRRGRVSTFALSPMFVAMQRYYRPTGEFYLGADSHIFIMREFLSLEAKNPQLMSDPEQFRKFAEKHKRTPERTLQIINEDLHLLTAQTVPPHELDVDSGERLESELPVILDLPKITRKLTPRQKEILVARLGRDERLKEIGDEIGVVAERVRQIANVGVKKIRKYYDPEGKLTTRSK